MEEESYLWAVIRYIEQNPVRAKLVRKAEDYRWSSARTHVLGIGDDMLSKESWFDEKELISYKEFVGQEDKEVNAAIRKATSTGRPLGSEEFIRKPEKVSKRELFPKKGGRPGKR